jgi:hypothetical protein
VTTTEKLNVKMPVKEDRLVNVFRGINVESEYIRTQPEPGISPSEKQGNHMQQKNKK